MFAWDKTVGMDSLEEVGTTSRLEQLEPADNYSLYRNSAGMTATPELARRLGLDPSA